MGRYCMHPNTIEEVELAVVYNMATHASLNDEEEMICCLLLLRNRRRWSTRPLTQRRQDEGGHNSLVRPMHGNISNHAHDGPTRRNMADWRELVVAEVRKYRHLYDSALKDHRDQNIVNTSWREIALTVGKNENAVKKCWKNLRDRYVKARKGAKGKRGDPGGSNNTSPILEELGWLSSFIKHRATETNVTSGVVEEESQSEADLLQPAPTPSPVPTSPSSSTNSEFSPSTLQNTFSFISPVGKVCSSPAGSGGLTSASEGPGPAPKRRKKMEDVLLKRLDDRIDEKETEEVRFGHVVADMLAKISPQKTNAVQFKIYQLLYEAIESDSSH